MTIYTFGDPELIREVLLALATVFNLVDWHDAGSAMGLGGNFLAMALIGLVAVAIAGVTGQNLRIDYLLVALILFGLMFSSKTDVNVEDIQTGDAAVVGDVPIGIALVASASSSAAASLTETVGTALQTPGRETSLLTDNGFLNPLRTLKGLQDVKMEELDTYLFQSMMTYYRFCVGRTRETSPGQFDMNQFLTTESPVTYMTNTANVGNWSTTYYSAANPAGTPTGCHAAAGLIRTRLYEIADGTTPEVEGYLRRVMGAKLYNQGFDNADIGTSVDLLFRGALTAQEFMANLFIRNMYNQMEALTTAEYGSNETQYVAQVTQAFEDKKTGAATEGSSFLQYMFPLMSFFQFLFFGIAPFIALVMVASPFTSAKVLGGYLLFGVWAYSWMPIAAIINHYMEISLQNHLSFSEVDLSNTGYTAILGFDDVYNLASTKLAIGSQALAATPVIVAAILSAGVFSITNMAKGLSQAGNANRVDTSLFSPKLGQNAPLVSVGGRFSAVTGTNMGEFGVSGAASAEQRERYLGNAYQTMASNQLSAGNAFKQEAGRGVTASISTASSALQRTMAQGGELTTLAKQANSAGQQAFDKQLSSVLGAGTAEKLTAAQRQELASRFQLPAVFANWSEAKIGTGIEGIDWDKALNTADAQKSQVQATVGEAVAAEMKKDRTDRGEFAAAAQEIYQALDQYQAAESYAETAEQRAGLLTSLSRGTQADTVDIAGIGMRKHGLETYELFRSALTGAMKSNKVADFHKEWLDEFMANPVKGINGKSDMIPDQQDMIGGMIRVLSRHAAAGDPDAMKGMAVGIDFLTGSDHAKTLGNAPEMIGEARGSADRIDVARTEAGPVIAGIDGMKTTSEGIEEIGSTVDERSAGIAKDAERLVDQNFNEEPELLPGQTNAVNEFADEQLGNVATGIDSDRARRAGSVTQEEVDGHRAEVQKAQDVISSVPARTSEKAYDLMDGNAGYLEESERVLRNLAAMPAGDDPWDMTDPRNRALNDAATSAVNELQYMMAGQQALDNGTGAQKAYNRYKEAGFTPRQAAFAAYVEIGKNRYGAFDNLVGGAAMMLSGGVADYGGKRAGMKAGSSALGLTRFLGTAAGAAGYAGWVAWHYKEDDDSAKESEARVRQMLIDDYRSIGGAGAEDFEAKIRAAGSGQDVMNVLEQYKSEITEERIEKVEREAQRYTADRWQGVLNPFNE
jgi:hypothetical protein